MLLHRKSALLRLVAVDDFICVLPGIRVWAREMPSQIPSGWALCQLFLFWSLFGIPLSRGLFVMRMMTKQFARTAGLFAFGVVLASCSNNQISFFETRDAQLTQGYSWQKLGKCRPARQGSQALPVTTSDGRRVVCYTLAPPKESQAGAAPEKPQAGPNQNAAQSAAPSMASDDSVNSAPPAAVDNSTNAPGVIWNFSNF